MFSQSKQITSTSIAGASSLSFHYLPSVDSSNFGKTWERCQSLEQVTPVASNVRGIWGHLRTWLEPLVVCGQPHCVISALAGRWATQEAMLAGTGVSGL